MTTEQLSKGVVYLETSALNQLDGMFRSESGIAFSNFLREQELAIRPSPIVFWEIFLTGNQKKREQLIYFSQHWMQNAMLPSPEEIITEYLRQGCPKEEPWRQLKSKTNMADVWASVYQDSRRTFIFKHEDVTRQAQVYREVSKMLRSVLNSESKRIEDPTARQIYSTLTHIFEHLSFVRSGEATTARERTRYMVAGFFVLTILCFELTFESNVISNYWDEIGISDPMKRLRYILHEHEPIFYRGPVATMGIMAELQLRKKHSRGLWMDCLHSLYVPYSNLFLSSDHHFVALRDQHPLFRKISTVNETFNSNMRNEA